VAKFRAGIVEPRQGAAGEPVNWSLTSYPYADPCADDGRPRKTAEDMMLWRSNGTLAVPRGGTYAIEDEYLMISLTDVEAGVPLSAAVEPEATEAPAPRRRRRKPPAQAERTR
jgi:hypothetical protein